MRVNDAVLGGLLLAFAVAVGLQAQTFPAIPGQQFGAAAFPTAIAVVLAALSVALIASGLRQWQGVVAWSDWARSRHGPINLGLAVAGVVFYVLLADILGFILTMTAVLLVLNVALGTRWPVALAAAVVVTLGIHLTFVRFLKVPLPGGLLPWLSW